MQIVRTIVWVLLVVALLIFSVANWGPIVSVRIWPGLLLDTKIPMVVIVSFLIGFLPMWLYARGVKWKLNRRIHSLENAARTVLATPVAPERPPIPDPLPEVVVVEETPLTSDTDEPMQPEAKL